MSGVVKGVKKVVKGIGKGVKKVVKKLGPVGMIAAAVAAPYIVSWLAPMIGSLGSGAWTTFWGTAGASGWGSVTGAANMLKIHKLVGSFMNTTASAAGATTPSSVVAMNDSAVQNMAVATGVGESPDTYSGIPGLPAGGGEKTGGSWWSKLTFTDKLALGGIAAQTLSPLFNEDKLIAGDVHDMPMYGYGPDGKSYVFTPTTRENNDVITYGPHRKEEYASNAVPPVQPGMPQMRQQGLVPQQLKQPRITKPGVSFA